MPGAFGGQQQPQQGRSVSTRLPNANNTSGWAFNAAVPMGGAAFQNQARQLGGNVSFAQSLSGSQPATPLDLSKHKQVNKPRDSSSAEPDSHSVSGLAYSDVLKLPPASGPANLAADSPSFLGHVDGDDRRRTLLSQALTNAHREFPSLSNNSQIPSTTQGSMWSTAGSSRTISGPIQRNQPAPGPSQQGGQDDLFGPPSSRMQQSSQGPFRFGPQPTQVQPSSVDDFPPLNRTSNGEIGSERGASLMSSLGFNPQNPGSSGPMQNNGGNGLLNALTATNRANEARSSPAIGTANGPGRQQQQQPPQPPTQTQPQPQPQQQQHDSKQKAATLREDDSAKASEVASPTAEGRGSLGVIGSEGPNGRSTERKDSQTAEVVDPLAGMPAVDKWGIKGLRTLMNTYPDYHAMIIGMDPSTIGLDLSSPELISTQVYSLFDDAPPKPTVNLNKFRLPECYSVTNVQPIDTKIQSFNEETLFWIFYSCPLDAKQQMAAVELHSRNWRWHKKLQVWLTKDEHMTPQILSPNHERGYYIVWDTATWRKDRREFTLHYGDLDTSLGQPPPVLS
ncbi:hypothetical protein MKX07_008343 [Trichoderma sp. CBMAI-0711]|nr:hypothetical protein MKX07_008343 [Trichoderma sp. CBMAI-0711]